ncbi:hypothetical protein MJO29_017053 [Puccinia striiformis f. sp. tritici]|nr:hypothetical protein MJO29_017053 [Puccinia striiformis f. sp. tritici]
MNLPSPGQARHSQLRCMARICPKCSKNKVFDQNNQQLSGMWVHPATRRKHWRSSSSQPQDELASLLQRASLQDSKTSTTSIPEAKQPDLSKKDAKKSYSTFELTMSVKLNVGLLGTFLCTSCKLPDKQKMATILSEVFPWTFVPSQSSSSYFPNLKITYVARPALPSTSPKTLPKQCTYRRAATVPICNEELFKIHPRKPIAVDFTTHLNKRPKPASTVHPYLGYSVQSFKSWISWFLGLNETEEEIGKWADKINVGFKVSTHKFPQGRKVSVHLGVLIGDIVATHKVAGHASHSATQPCSWCDVKKDEIEKMRIGKMKNSRNVRMAASAWKELKTLTAKKEHVKKQGVRWSELNRLPYWDPVRSVSLGVMHNWLEGVLKHHWSERWGYHKKKYKVQEDETTDDSDSSQGSTVRMDDEEIESWEISMLKHIRVQVAEVVVPQGITRVPLNLGEASHGKIKASEWHALFSIYLPLALPDLLVTNAEEEYSKTRPWLILLNFAALVKCTNIITQKSVSKKDGETFQKAYEAYTYSSETVFSNIRINPNHHYALHLPQQMNWWGPPMAIAEFSSERINGLLQSFETNGQLGKIEEIVMRKFCQTQRIKAQDPFAELCQAEDHESESAKKGIIDMQVYESILEEVKLSFPEMRDFRTMTPHQPNSKVLTRYATDLGSYRSPWGLYFSKNSPNACVKYEKNGTVGYGWVVHIYDVEEAGLGTHRFVVLKEMGDGSRIEGTNPSSSFLRFLGDMQLVLATNLNKFTSVSPENITNVCAYRHLPAGTFGYRDKTILLRPIEHDPNLSPACS